MIGIETQIEYQDMEEFTALAMRRHMGQAQKAKNIKFAKFGRS
jgi:hypothetical protein